ncbi:MAG: hypothetical protein RLZZ175_99 [Bacteroidota bacterium]|jgi:nucleoside-diphosphate-sugar epimerase
MSKIKVFVTGASSEIIQDFISICDPSEYHFYCLTRQSGFKNYSNITWVFGDLLNINSYSNELISCDLIIHAAAITHSFTEEPYFEVNFKATQKLVDLFAQFPEKKFVFISSRTASIESGAYGESKFLAENYIKQKLANWLIIRPSEVFGTTKNEAIAQLIQDASQKKIMLCPVGMKSAMFPIFVNDLNQLMYEAIFIKKLNQEILHLNGNESFTFYSLITLVNKILGNKTLIIPIPKIGMYCIAFLLKLFKINVGVMPDQIPRLYSSKQHSTIDFKFFTIETFIKKHFSKTENH